MITDMTYMLILILHIIGACLTGLVASYTGVALWHKSSESYRPLSITLGICAAFEVLTGTALSVISIQISTLSLCSNIALYLLACGIFEALLFARMKKIQVRFPFEITASPVLASLALMMVAIGFGF